MTDTAPFASAADPQRTDAHPSRSRRAVLSIIAVTVVVTALIVGAVAFSVGRLSTIADATPETTSAEAGFTRDMQEHHDQGVELAMIVRERTEDAPVRLLAYDIAITQAKQSGQMSGWLAIWGLPQFSPEPSMIWMTRPTLAGESHDNSHTIDGESTVAHVAGDPMPGLATDAEVASLAAASGVEAERQFLVVMIAHHQGAIEMADAVLDRSTNATVLTFATAVVLSQQSEIDLMTDMLAERS